MNQPTTFVQELACSFTGEDNPATVAWLAQQLKENCEEYASVEAHWRYASDKERDAIAAWLGISEPFPNGKGPLPKVIGESYQAVWEFCEDLDWEQEK